MSEKRCTGNGGVSSADKGYEEVRIEKSKNVCNVCEDYAKRQSAKPVAVMSCDGACLRPVERRFVAALTVLVICGLACAEMIAVREGAIGAWRMAPTWLLQAALLLLLAAAYHRSMPGKAHANAGTRSR